MQFAFDSTGTTGIDEKMASGLEISVVAVQD
jgi:hypothetical protein